MKRKVILVTDGDDCAKRAVEIAAHNIGARCISKSAGNPTPLTGVEIIELVKTAVHDPVVVMVDDRGNTHRGLGEQAMDTILNSPEIDVLGVVAVASNTHKVKGVKVDYSVDQNGRIIKHGVDKHGIETKDKIVKGDTVDVLNDNEDIPVIIGVGDPGKMDGFDSAGLGAPVITKALEKIIELNK